VIVSAQGRVFVRKTPLLKRGVFSAGRDPPHGGGVNLEGGSLSKKQAVTPGGSFPQREHPFGWRPKRG